MSALTRGKGNKVFSQKKVCGSLERAQPVPYTLENQRGSPSPISPSWFALIFFLQDLRVWVGVALLGDTKGPIDWEGVSEKRNARTRARREIRLSVH